MATAKQVVDIATAEIGYHEKASNYNLDSKTGNSGSANWTKYARDLANANYYNGNKNGFEWCDVFVDWCFFKAFGKTEAQLIECQTGELGAACPYSAGYYKNQGLYDRNPKVGDQVFFQQGGKLVHTGIVVEVGSTTVTIVEGNKTNQVVKITYKKSDPYIGGYGHPKYDAVKDPWEKDGDGEYHFRNPKTGEYVKDVFVCSERGMWYYIGEDTKVVHSGLTRIHDCPCIDHNGDAAGTSPAGYYYLQEDNTNGTIGACKVGKQTIVKSAVDGIQGVNTAVFEESHNGHWGACVSINGKPVKDYTELPE